MEYCKIILLKQTIVTAGLTLLVAGVIMWPRLMRDELQSDEGINQRIILPAPRTDGAISIEKALRERRSIREFKKKTRNI